MPERKTAWEEIATIGDHELERRYLDIPKIKQILYENKELKFDDDGAFDIKIIIQGVDFFQILKKLQVGCIICLQLCANGYINVRKNRFGVKAEALVISLRTHK